MGVRELSCRLPLEYGGLENPLCVFESGVESLHSVWCPLVKGGLCPKNFRAVRFEFSVVGDEGQIFVKCLSEEHAVKWGLMMRWEVVHAFAVGVFEREFEQASSGDFADQMIGS